MNRYTLHITQELGEEIYPGLRIGQKLLAKGQRALNNWDQKIKIVGLGNKSSLGQMILCQSLIGPCHLTDDVNKKDRLSNYNADNIVKQYE